MKKKNLSWLQSSKINTAIFSFVSAVIVIAVGYVMLYAGSHFVGNSKVAFAEPTPVDLPTKLVIPSINIDAVIQIVGLAASGRMGIPTNFTDVAWYKEGPKPGEAGSAVIDGHLDTARDANAVFARLSELKSGDEIYVVDKKGQKIKFRVTDKEIYSDTDAPVSKIFSKTGATARLNLITCDGAWDQTTKNYSKRLVIYSERAL